MIQKLLLFVLLTAVVSCTVLGLKQRNMTVKQTILKAIYPITMGISKAFFGKGNIQINIKNNPPTTSFYDLTAISSSGETINFSQFKGKKILLVNTASNCGYTAQYAELEKLYQQYHQKLVVIAFPSNDFKEQEQLDDQHIAQFCKLNYGVTFLLMKKSEVVKGLAQNDVFHWLSYAVYNGWCNQQPTWNFCKYLVNENGVLTHFFPQTISPLSNSMNDALQ